MKMIKLRLLENKDVPFMLEWMADKDITCFFQNEFEKMNKKNVYEFIKKSFTDVNKHFAIIDDEDEYLGTISLKNISFKNKNAEYAIVTRKSTWGKGISNVATKEILKYAFEDLKLHKVYLNVLSNNYRAIKFYEKMGFNYEGEFKHHIKLDNKYEDLKWFGIINE